MRPWLCTVAMVQQAPTSHPGWPLGIPYLVNLPGRYLVVEVYTAAILGPHVDVVNRIDPVAEFVHALVALTAQRVAENNEQGCDEGCKMMSRMADPSAVDGKMCEMGGFDLDLHNIPCPVRVEMSRVCKRAEKSIGP